MSMKVFLDLESLPPAKDDPLVSDRLAQITDEEYRRMALDGKYGRLLCIGLIIEQDNQVVHRGVLGRDKQTMRFHLDEARTLRALWKLLKDFSRYHGLFIGHNILDFDLHFLYQRSIIRRVKPSVEACFTRFRKQPVFDCMWEFSYWKRRISLNELAKVLGLKSSKDDEVNGSRIYDLFLQDRHQEIADYCIRDVELTRSIYHRLTFLEEDEPKEAA